MAKAPRPGFCKTRLVPPLTPAEAAALGAAFLRDVTANLAAGGSAIAPYVAFAPASAGPDIAAYVAPGTQLLVAEGRAPAPPGVSGFGACLFETIVALLADGHHAAGVLNADSPTLPADILPTAAAWLASDPARVVLGPAADGGYYFLGMTAAHAALFADIAWSTGVVAEQTRARAQAVGLAVRELPAWYDVDDGAALARLRQEIGEPAIAARAPSTAAWFAAQAAGVAA